MPMSSLFVHCAPFSVISPKAGLIAAICGLSVAALRADDAMPITRVACVGDSITFGAGTTLRAWDCYPSQLQRLLGGERYVVENFGSSGATALNSGDGPYSKRTSYQQALKSRPDVVVIMLGTNDTKPQNWQYKDRFVSDYESLIRSFQALQPCPRVFVCLPPWVDRLDPKSINEPVLLEQQPLIRKVAGETKAGLIDLHAVLKDRADLLADHVHPDTAGAALLAKAVFAAITGREFAGDVPDTLASKWNGYDRVDFTVGGRTALLVSPKSDAPGCPWIWRTEFFGAFPSVDLALLAKGWHVAYLGVPNLYGAPEALEAMDGFPAYLKSSYDLAAKPVLEGFSRGGLYAFNWAARHPERVAALYVDAPVCDFKSWPAGKGRGKGSPADWARCLKAYGLTEQQALAYGGNPVDNLTPIAAAHIPIIAVAGDADRTVPLDENIGVVVKRYRELGGEIQLIVKPGADHHPHSLPDPTPIVNFLVSHMPVPVR